MEKVVIIDALRTPIGKYKGSLSRLTAVELGTAVTKSLLARNEAVMPRISQVIFGNVLQAGNGQNPARQIGLHSGLAQTVPAMTVNEVCGSSLKAIALGRQQIQLGEATAVLVGGIESMSNAPAATVYDRETDSYSKPVPTMVHDGLTDAFSGKHMGLTAENVAEQFGVTREMQDTYAATSQQKAAQAQAAGHFKAEITPVTVGETVVTEDEGIRAGSTVDKLATLKAVFKENGSVTAGNASTINDGASALILMAKSQAEALGLSYLAEIEDVTEVGFDPSIMGVSPISAIDTLFTRNGLTAADIDLFEINEAFAASSIVVNRELRLETDKVNIDGGAIALGHPIGATGARIVTTLLHQLAREDKTTGVASLCVGGGIGLAILLKRPTKAA